MAAETDPDQQYTDDGERENPDQMPDIGSDPTEMPQEEPGDPSEPPGDDDKSVPEGTGGSRTEGGAGMIQTE